MCGNFPEELARVPKEMSVRVLGVGRRRKNSPSFDWTCTATSALPFSIPEKELRLTWEPLHGERQKRGPPWISDYRRNRMVTDNTQSKQNKAKPKH